MSLWDDFFDALTAGKKTLSFSIPLRFSWTGDTEARLMLITVTRTHKTVDGAFGNLMIDLDPFKCVTLERLATLIPVGVYDLRFMWSEHFQQIMPHVFGVPGRTAIEMHWANYPNQLDGCTALGSGADFAGDMIVESKNSWIEFVQAITDQPTIKIRYVEDYGS